MKKIISLIDDISVKIYEFLIKNKRLKSFLSCNKNFLILIINLFLLGLSILGFDLIRILFSEFTSFVIALFTRKHFYFYEEIFNLLYGYLYLLFSVSLLVVFLNKFFKKKTKSNKEVKDSTNYLLKKFINIYKYIFSLTLFPLFMLFIMSLIYLGYLLVNLFASKLSPSIFLSFLSFNIFLFFTLKYFYFLYFDKKQSIKDFSFLFLFLIIFIITFSFSLKEIRGYKMIDHIGEGFEEKKKIYEYDLKNNYKIVSSNAHLAYSDKLNKKIRIEVTYYDSAKILYNKRKTKKEELITLTFKPNYKLKHFIPLFKMMNSTLINKKIYAYDDLLVGDVTVYVNARDKEKLKLYEAY